MNTRNFKNSKLKQCRRLSLKRHTALMFDIIFVEFYGTSDAMPCSIPARFIRKYALLWQTRWGRRKPRSMRSHRVGEECIFIIKCEQDAVKVPRRRKTFFPRRSPVVTMNFIYIIFKPCCMDSVINNLDQTSLTLLHHYAYTYIIVLHFHFEHKYYCTHGFVIKY